MKIPHSVDAAARTVHRGSPPPHRITALNARRLPFASLLLLTLAAPLHAAENWPRFRGPDGTGVAGDVRFPATFTKDDFAWVADVPGGGQSSPVVWGDTVFVTGSEDDGRTRQLHALDAAIGVVRWTRTVPLPPGHMHRKNGPASATPATDGERVVAAFADEQHLLVTAWDMGGRELWSRDLGTFVSQHGHGASPVFAGGHLIVTNDQNGRGGVLALDPATGETVWSTDRDSGKAAYAAPFLLDRPGLEPQLVTANTSLGMVSLDPQTGDVNWSTGPLPDRVVGSPVFAAGRLWLTCGSGGSGKMLIAVDPADGTVAETLTRRLPYVPTPVAKGDALFMILDSGAAVRLDAISGDEVWAGRLPATFSGSPVIAGDSLFVLSEDGELFVLGTGDRLEVLGRTPLGSMSYATPAITEDKMYLRTAGKLFAVKATPR